MAKAKRIVFMGTPEFAVPSLEALISAGYKVVMAITQPDKPVGRGLATRACPVKQAAIKHGIEVFGPPSLRAPDVVQKIKSLSPDIIAVVAYGKLLPEAVLNIPPMGCINVHASILPMYRGAAPINWAIINGEKETGVTTMYMDVGMDTGPALLEERVSIGEDETALGLSLRLSQAGAGLLVKTIALLSEGRLNPVEQDDSKATYAPVLKKEDGKIDWEKDALAIRDLMRGVYPWPGAHTTWGGKVLKIHAGSALKDDKNGEMPGTVLEAEGDRIVIACGNGLFEINELQPENKRRMSAGDFLKGYRLKKGERLG